MTVAELSDRDQAKLQPWQVHPALLDAYLRIQPAMASFGAPIFLIFVGRTAKEQQALYAKGRSQPGKVVTYLDGVLKTSKHQPQHDGLVHAIDFAFVNDPRTPRDETWDADMPWAVVGQMAEHLGLVWGGRWKMRDLGHIEVK